MKRALTIGVAGLALLTGAALCQTVKQGNAAKTDSTGCVIILIIVGLAVLLLRARDRSLGRVPARMSKGKKIALAIFGFALLSGLSMYWFGGVSVGDGRQQSQLQENAWLILPAVVAVAWLAFRRWRKSQRANDLAALVECSTNLGVFISKNFLVSACPTCRETLMHLTSISPSARTITYSCLHCGEKKQRQAEAGTPQALVGIGDVSAPFFAAQRRFKERWGETLTNPAPFQTAVEPLPFEQTSRGPIPRAISAEVWRRDQGKCAECGSNQNLQYDHIIPVAKGGATTAANLQLLCRQCNLSKGARI